MTRPLRPLAVALLLGLAACDSGPSGPGTLDATVTSETPLGAVVLELTGPGIRGFTEQGSARAFGAAVAPAEGRHRVVVVAPDGQALRFGIEVDDVGADLPAVTVVQAVGPNDILLLTAGVGVRIER